MTLPDIINGAFEALGGLAMLGNIRRILRDKAVAGVDLSSTTFFVSWGIWNAVFYYPSLRQWASFAGCLVIVIGNAVWLGLAFYYRSLRPVLA